MEHATDQLRPFTIKALPGRVADEITETARVSVPRQTVGQILEKVWEHWKDGVPVIAAPVPLANPARGMPTVEQVATAIDAAFKVSNFGDGIDKTSRADANRLVRVMILDLKLRYRFAIGMTGNKPPPLEGLLGQAERHLAIAAE